MYCYGEWAHGYLVERAHEVVFLGDLGGEVSSRLSFMRFSYDLSTVVPLSNIITYGGDVCSSDSCSKVYVDGDAIVLSIGYTGTGMLLMVPRVGGSLC